MDADRLILEQLGNIVMNAIEKVPPRPYRIDIDVERSRELLLRDASLDRSHDHVMLLYRRKPIDALVVRERLVVLRNDAARFRSPALLQNAQTHVSVQQREGFAGAAIRHHKRFDKTHFGNRRRDPFVFCALNDRRRQHFGGKNAIKRHCPDLLLK
ncbi:hypothetical protein D3C87_1466350 [compost metagenome]